MPVIAYLANLFPAASERYVADEIGELRDRGYLVIPCSVRGAALDIDGDLKSWLTETVCLWPLRLGLTVKAAWLCLTRLTHLNVFLFRILLRGTESPGKRLRALAHTFLGAYYAAVIEKFHPQHIHVHHGYFGSWIAMVAARLLGIDFSMTLHGSDVLLHPAYLDLKLELCQLCVTISDFNRRHLVAHYPFVDTSKIVVQRLGVDAAAQAPPALHAQDPAAPFVIFAAGRLSPVKDHAFLIRACGVLKSRGLKFTCLIAGEGPKRRSLEVLIRDFGLQNEVRLLGQIAHEQMSDYYRIADLVVLTSRSEGIPVVLMEAMAHEKLVLAPNITGIPELVRDGNTGFLYRPGSMEDFVDRVEIIHHLQPWLGGMGRAARECVLERFDRRKNLAAFCDRLIAAFAPPTGATGRLSWRRISHEDPVLQ